MNLKNHFLIAMPSLDDPLFEHSVVYICEHNQEGAMGLVINRPIPDLSVSMLLSKLDIDRDLTNPAILATLSAPVFAGGPLADDRGFILHSPIEGFSSSLPISDTTMVTTSKDVLEALGTDKQPKEVLVALGYSSWSAGQLEQEIVDNAWLVVEADNNLLFHTPIEQRWHLATQKLGFDISAMANHVGHA